MNLKIIFILIAIGVLNIISVIGYIAGFIGHSIVVTKLVNMFEMVLNLSYEFPIGISI